MAALRAPSPTFLAAFLPVARAQLLPQSQPVIRRIPLINRPRTSASLLPAALVPIPALLGDIWNGILNAVPKKKTSHAKKRHRLLASGKHLKDVTALNKCSSCGRMKRAHVLCPYCVQSIRRWFGTGFKSQREIEAQEEERLARINEERRVKGRPPLETTKKGAEEKDEAKA